MPANKITSTSKIGQTTTWVGTAGMDYFYGGKGIDYFKGMGGGDIVNGGTLTIIDFRWAPAAISVNLSKGSVQQTGGAGLITLIGVRGVEGTVFADLIWGHNHNDILNGNAGNDEIHGSLGLDGIDGGPGNDRLYGGDGADNIVGGLGDDLLYGENQNDSLSGGAGNDVLNGGNANDQLDGGAGNDRLIGGAGIDIIKGGDGWDVADLSNASGAVTIDRRDVTGTANRGEAQYDGYSGVEGYDLSRFNDHFIAHAEVVTVDGREGDDRLIGSGGDDTLIGGLGNDILEAGGGGDILYGGAGNDILDGGGARDLLYGGAGNDTFLFGPGSWHSRYPDEIFEWNKGDKIDLSRLDPRPGGADDKFVFIKGSAFTAAGQIGVERLDFDTVRVFADSNGDKVADFFLLVHTTATLSAADFNL